MVNWNYGDAYMRHPISLLQTAVFPDGSTLKVHDIFNPLPKFMLQADCLFIDPPWNIGNLTSFYTKANLVNNTADFHCFYKRLFECIKQIHPQTCYVEVGKDYLAEFITEMKQLYRVVTFYNSGYFHKKGNFCYIIRGGEKRVKLPLDGVDEEDIIAYICKNEAYTCIGDLCMGQGLVAVNAALNNRKFVGTELNPRRLSVTLEKLVSHGKQYCLVEE